MGHTRADVFRRHYMHQTVKVDTQSAYPRTANQSNLVKNIGQMSISMGPRAPVKLGAEDLEKHQDYPTLSALQLEKDNLKTTLKTKCGSIKAAKTLLPEQHREYTRLSSQISAARKRIERAALKDIRAKWFENVDHDQIKQQIRSEAPPKFAYSRPQPDYPRRSSIARVFCFEDSEVGTWPETVHVLPALCLQKPKIHRKERRGEEFVPVLLYR